MKTTRSISNFEYFKDTLGSNWKYAYSQFQNEFIENDMIVANYDEEGYCLFDRTNEEFVWEFTGTAK